MDTMHQTTATSSTRPEITARLRTEFDEELTFAATAWVEHHVDPRVYVEGPEWVRKFGDALGEVRVAAGDAKERQDDVETQFWAAVHLALGSVLMHQADKLDGRRSKRYAAFQKAVIWWVQPDSSELSILSVGLR